MGSLNGKYHREHQDWNDCEDAQIAQEQRDFRSYHATRQAWPDVLPRTNAGTIKQRLTWEEKLHVLDHFSTLEATETRLIEFAELFAFCFTNAIITRANGGPRDWTTMRGRLSVKHIVRHLLADRIPGRSPVWVGARSFNTTRFYCIDVDVDRTPEQVLADDCDANRVDDLEAADGRTGSASALQQDLQWRFQRARMIGASMC